MDILWQSSACELSEGLRRGGYSCRDVMESVVARIRAKNGELNAIVYDYTEEALAEARRADEELASGRIRGPHHGIPVTIKENVDQLGKPTPNGIPAFAGVIAPDDAPLVRNLRRTIGSIRAVSRRAEPGGDAGGAFEARGASCGCAWRWKRATRSRSWAKASGSTLTATSRFRRVSGAR